MAFLEQNNILFDYQYGFRRLYLTTLAVIEFFDNIQSGSSIKGTM